MSSCFYVPVFLLVAVVHAVPRKRASDYFDICHTLDPKFNDCVQNVLVNSREEFIKGIPALRLLPIDPLEIEKMEFRQGTGGKFQIYMKLTNIKLHGLSNYSIKYFNFDYEKKQWNHTLSFPVIKMEGDYEMKGKFLYLPIEGNGTVDFSCRNVTSDSRTIFEEFEKNKEIYTKIKDYKLCIEPGWAQIHFTNLFSRDRRLSHGMDRYINNKWKEAFASYRDIPETAFAEFIKNHMNNVFTKFPENEILPK